MKIQFSPSHSACFGEKHVVKIEFSYEDSENVERFEASRMVTKLIFSPNQYVEWILAFLEKSDFDYATSWIYGVWSKAMQLRGSANDKTQLLFFIFNRDSAFKI